MRRLALAVVAIVGGVGCADSGTLVVRPGSDATPDVEDSEVGWLDTGTAGPLPTTEDDAEYAMTGFSFIDDDVAGMPQPGRWVPLEDDLSFVADQDITLLVSLTVTPVDAEAARALGLEVLHLPIEDFHPPTPEQQRQLVDELSTRVAAGQRVGVHCTAGLGRTGTMLATWLVSRGYDADGAITEVRAQRPGSIETEEQEQSVHRFAAEWTAR